MAETDKLVLINHGKIDNALMVLAQVVDSQKHFVIFMEFAVISLNKEKIFHKGRVKKLVFEKL